MKTIGPIIFGEVLFDCFPDGSAVLGGAPFNVYAHLGRMGLDPLMITRVGEDERGNQLLAAMGERNLHTEGVQSDPSRFTGEVVVTIDEEGHPQFDIRLGQAWDGIDADEALGNLAGQQPSMLYCGTLALRSETSRKACLRILEETEADLFLDVNLRDPWWERPLVDQLLSKATWLKCNEQEGEMLFGIKDEYEGRSRLPEICRNQGLRQLILTLSERGAMVTDGENIWQAAPPQDDRPFLDSVGAGDACACGLIEGILKRYDPETSIHNALELANEICRTRGGVFPI